MNCPTCETTQLKKVQIGESDVELDCCPRCKGTWFDPRELESLLKIKAKDIGPPRRSGRSKRHCPRCDTKLRLFHYPGTLVAVAMCDKCRGIWLEKGEFREIHQIRTYIRGVGVFRPDDEPQTIKEGLLRFIDRALGNMWSEYY
jgi:Zn-finger nucleic acid-binding protein